jgi:hypothetical protein
MTKYIFAFAFVALLAVVGCQKKDDGAAPAVGCPPSQVMSPFYGRCLAQASCPQGLAQSPDQPTMCLNIATGVQQMTMQCGAGFNLTTSGCLQQGLCPPGKAQSGVACLDIIAAGTSSPYQTQGQYQQQAYPQYQQQAYPQYQQAYPQYQGYQQYPNYFGRPY